MIVLLLGGARSGKSAAAEQIVAALPAPVTYVATLAPDASDPDLTCRIAMHRARRPTHWTTVNCDTDLPEQLNRLTGTVLLDSLGPWVAGHRPDATEFGRLAEVLTRRAGNTVVVSDEVGLSVHPSTERGREFRDDLGRANSAVAAVAGEVLLIVAGRVLTTAPLDPARVLASAR